jgi:hypothetical protein
MEMQFVLFDHNRFFTHRWRGKTGKTIHSPEEEEAKVKIV